MTDHGGVYGSEIVSIVALFRYIQNIVNIFHLEYFNNHPDRYIILLQVLFLFLYNVANTV
jgi:hypothetical protein